MDRFLLQPHVFMCVTQHGGFILDEEKDEYLGLSPHRMRTLSYILQGAQSCSDDPSIDKSAAMQLAAQLAQAGVLTLDSSIGKPVTPIQIQACDRDIEWGSMEARIYFHHLRAFFAATARTILAMRRQTHAEVMRALRREKESRASHDQCDIQIARHLTYIFRCIRPVAYTWHDQCLFDCLTLMHFLLHYGLCPTMVFGIQPRPFLAHCWVQIEHHALSCPAEYTRAFTPIRII